MDKLEKKRAHTISNAYICDVEFQLSNKYSNCSTSLKWISIILTASLTAEPNQSAKST